MKDGLHLLGASIWIFIRWVSPLINPMHRYEQVDGQALGYDLKGNLLGDGVNTYTYDVQNQQITMSGPGGTAEYVYGALGRRVAKVVESVTTYFVYNAFYQVLEERDGSNQLLARYTYGAGIDEVLTMERGGATYTYHRDALGSITEVTNVSGSLVERYEYDVYGTASIFDGSNNPLTASAIGNPYLFTARRYDPESGNYYYRARIYSPTLGRFLQMDPLGYVDGMNLYAYVGNNPSRFTDPFGYGEHDYHFNPNDNSVTFVGTGATIWEAVHRFEELGYANWQEAVKAFAQVYPGAETWWGVQGNWTGQPGATLVGKTLPGKKKPTPVEPTPPPSCDPPGPMPFGPWPRPFKPLCDLSKGWDYHWERRYQTNCWRRFKKLPQNPEVLEDIYRMGLVDKKIAECVENPPLGGQELLECLAAFDAYVDAGTDYSDLIRGDY